MLLQDWMLEVLGFLRDALRDHMHPASDQAKRNEPPQIALAFSGGADSVALVHLLAVVLPEICQSQGSPLPWSRLRLIHVNHHLGPHAAPMRRFCEQFASVAGLPLEVLDVEVPVASRRSLEAEARDVRYRVLAGAMAQGEALLTAHHADDQSETVLLNLLRGSGPAGLAGMARMRRLAPAGVGSGPTPRGSDTLAPDTWLLRPLLTHPRARLRALVEAAGLSWFEDPSNQDPTHLRNWLRSEIMPRLNARQPGLNTALARTARLLSAHQRFVSAAAAPVLAAACDEDCPAELLLTPLAGEDPLVVQTVLREWIRLRLGRYPDERAVERIVEGLLTAAPGRAPEVRVDSIAVRRYRDRLYALARSTPLRETDAGLEARSGVASFAGSVWRVSALPATLSLPHGALRAEGLPREPDVLTQGGPGSREVGRAACCVRPDAILADGPLKVSPRTGGERILTAGGHHRALKDLLREAGVPPWRRDSWPLVYAGDTLIAVPGIIAAADRVPGRHEPAVRIDWTPHNGT